MPTPSTEQIDPASLILVQEPVFIVCTIDQRSIDPPSENLPGAFHPFLMANSAQRGLYGPASASHSAFYCCASTCASVSSAASLTTTSLFS